VRTAPSSSSISGVVTTSATAPSTAAERAAWARIRAGKSGAIWASNRVKRTVTRPIRGRQALAIRLLVRGCESCTNPV